MIASEAQQVARAWHEAALDLGLSITTPFILKDVDGSNVEFIALIENFASPNGVLLCGMNDWQSVHMLARRHGYYASGINLARYARYERGFFVDTLRDWGWHGLDTSPRWL